MKRDEEEREDTHAQPAHRYGDPLEVLIREESRTCRGCVHEIAVLERLFCGAGKRHGRRCKIYIERRGLGR